MRVLGIDPGRSGALCLLDTVTHTAVYSPIPWAGKLIDYCVLDQIMGSEYAGLIALEEVRGRGGWGATQTFTFGCNYGLILAWVGVRKHILVPPKTWQNLAHLGAKGDTPKAKSLDSFNKINPTSKIKNDGVIDAFHIARYGLLQFGRFTDGWKFVKFVG